MAEIYQIAVVGDWESVMGFRALGLDTYPVTSTEEAKKTVHELAGTEEGYEFEKDGSSGGDLRFSDLALCDIEYTDDEE